MTLLLGPLVRGLHRDTPDFGRKAGNDNVNSLGTLKGGIFDRPLSVGEFAHICTFHSNMEGTLSVQ